MTEQAQSVEDAIRSSRWLLDGMLRSLPIASVKIFDRDLRHLYVAGAIFDRVGLSPDVVIGHRFEDLFPADVVDEVGPFLARAFAGETVTFTTTAMEHEYSVRAWPLTERDGAVNAIVALTQEISIPPSAEALSPRLREIAMLIAVGLTNQQIARRLHLKNPTVRNYVTQIMKRLDFRSRTQIGVWAARHGLYHPDEGSKSD